MERTEVLDMMGELKLFGMKAAYDETLATALRRQHEPQRFLGDLLSAEIAEKQAPFWSFARSAWLDDVRDYQVHRASTGVAWGSLNHGICAVRFFCVTLDQATIPKAF